MIDVCFVKTGRSFLPEIYAYISYLNKKGITTCIADDLKQAKKKYSVKFTIASEVSLHKELQTTLLKFMSIIR
jgi:hypothetical protein